MMLRRLKEDVEKSLAPKEETIVEVRGERVSLHFRTCGSALLCFPHNRSPVLELASYLTSRAS